MQTGPRLFSAFIHPTYAKTVTEFLVKLLEFRFQLNFLEFHVSGVSLHTSLHRYRVGIQDGGEVDLIDRRYNRIWQKR